MGVRQRKVVSGNLRLHASTHGPWFNRIGGFAGVKVIAEIRPTRESVHADMQHIFCDTCDVLLRRRTQYQNWGGATLDCIAEWRETTPQVCK
jgi:hypothetical protein